MEIEIKDPQSINRDVSKLLYAAVTPRPIAWVSSLSADGVPNLAPYSFFNAVCRVPPTVLFCSGYQEQATPKDTLANVQATGEFVINFVTEANAEAMNITADTLPPHIDEFERAGLTKLPSAVVKPPRVKESPIHFECKLNQIVHINEAPGGGTIVIGTVVHMHADDTIYDAERGYVDFDAYQVVGRMAGNGYTTTRDRFDMIRPTS